MINVIENKILGPMILEKIEEGREQIRAQAREHWFSEGLSQGLSQGLRHGLRHGQQQILREQLYEKFGIVPEWASQRLENASSAELHAWAKRILRYRALEEIFS